MIVTSGVKSTEILHPEDVNLLCGKCKNASEKWAVTAERLWNNSSKTEKKLQSFNL